MKKNAVFELNLVLSRVQPDSLFETLPEKWQSNLTVEEKPDGETILKAYCESLSQAKAFEKELRPLFPVHKTLIKKLPFHQWSQRWKKGLKTIRISSKLVICPSWIKYKRKASEEVIRVDPGMAFGTGHHATTCMCLEWLEPRAKSWQNICDVGCGSGILAISAIRLGTKKAVGIDIDPEAIETAEENAQRNQTARQIKWLISDIGKKKLAKKFDCVLANLTARDIQKNWTHILRLVKPRRNLILAGIEASQIHWFEPWLQNQKKVQITDRKTEGGWHGYLLARSSQSA